MAKPTYPAKKDNRNYKTIGIVILVLVIIAAALVIFKSCSGDTEVEPTPSGGTGIVYDDNAAPGGWDEADVDKIVERLNEKVEKGMINISMNTSPNFANGTSTGNLMIVNESVNNYPQVVEITRNDTDEKIYTSGAIAVGSKVENAKLDVDLDKGTYDCTAMFYNVDLETGSYLGCAGAIITVTILE